MKDKLGKEISFKDTVKGCNGKLYVISGLQPDGNCVCVPEEGLTEILPAGELEIVNSLVQDLLSLKSDSELEALLAGLKLTPLETKRPRKKKAQPEVEEVSLPEL